jgi:hypothetical protein
MDGRVSDVAPAPCHAAPGPVLPAGPALSGRRPAAALPPARRWRGYGVPPPAFRPEPAPEPVRAPAPRWSWGLEPDQLLGAAEMLISLGTRGRLSESVQATVDGYRALVRLWAGPHLYPGDPDTPCPGCGGVLTLETCPFRASLRQVLGDAAAGFRPPSSPPE